jgi:hypothetical protein
MRQFPLPEPTSVETFPPILLLHELFVELQVKSPIFPGEPITFSWSAITFSARPLDLGTVTFALHLVDVYGNTDPTALLYSETLSTVDSANVTPADYQSNNYAVQLTGDLASRVYLLGTYTLRLVITGTGTDGPFRSGDTILVVQPENVNSTWWNWTVPTQQYAQWKVDKYVLQGEFINRAKYVSVTATATMLETNLTDGGGPGKEIGSDQPGAPAGAGQSAAISFGQIDFSKNWWWFIPVVFLPNGAPREKLYMYQVRLDVLDQYNNGYPPAVTDAVWVDVKVSDTKRAALATAAGLLAAAGVCLVGAAANACTPAGPILGGIATGLAAAAEIVGMAANDPPVPHPGYKIIFMPHPVTLPEERDLEGVLTALRAVFAVIAHVEALGETDSRIAGARSVRDHRAEKLQAEHFDGLRGELRKLSRRIRKLTPLAARFLASHPTFTPQAILRGIDQWRYDIQVRARLQRDYFNAGGSLDSFRAIEQFLHVPDALNCISDPSSVMMAIGKWGERLAEAAAASSPTAYASSRDVKATTKSGRRPL